MRPGSGPVGGAGSRPGAGARPGGRPPANAAVAAAMAGAVDLAAVRARSEAAARAAQAPPPAADSAVVDVTEATFQAEVIDRSFQVPVVLDLWADWCEPCKTLSPILERLAKQANGAWVLAKVDVEANQRIASALQVQSIPSVFAAIGGQFVPGFQGALPEAQVREFVDAVIDAGARAGLKASAAPADAAEDEPSATPEIPEPVEAPEDPRIAAAEEALDAGDYDAAAQRYQAILDQEPANDEARFALGQVSLMQRLETLDPSVVARAEANPDDVEAQLGAADLSFAANDISGAFGRLLRTVATTAGDDRERLRKRLLEYFDLLGPDDPRVPSARRELARSLF